MKYYKFTPAALLMLIFPVAMLPACNQQITDVNETEKSVVTEQDKLVEQASGAEQTGSTEIWPKLTFEVKQDQEIESKVIKTLATMTLEQKVAQMIQPEIRDITPEDMRKYGFAHI